MLEARNLAGMPVFWMQLVADDNLRNIQYFQVGGCLVDTHDDGNTNADGFVADPTDEQLPMLTDVHTSIGVMRIDLCF